jgi:hypothetical protein
VKDIEFKPGIVFGEELPSFGFLHRIEVIGE